jgi:hypothetical protein
MPICSRRLRRMRVPCQNSFMAADLVFRAHSAALRYSLIKPPRTCLRSIRGDVDGAAGLQRRFLLQNPEGFQDCVTGL